MSVLQNAANRAEFLDAIEELQETLMKIDEAPYGDDVYRYAICFFTVLKNFEKRYNTDKIFFTETDRLSKKSLGIFLFKSWLHKHVRVKNNEKITLSKIYLSNPVISMQDLAQNKNKSLTWLNMKNDLDKMRNLILSHIASVQTDLRRPSNIILKLAGYKNQNIK
ncbi:MAG: hypothetical protein IKL14_05320 [Alphaproteobacteria bacterium]|nr:hypothetical protein [Alphaproteobacteria bacterium]